MDCRLQELRCREVINIRDGCRIGFISDLQIDVGCGRIIAIIIPGRYKFFGLFGREDDYCIPWECIKRFGDDIVLVDINPEKCRAARPKSSFLRFI